MSRLLIYLFLLGLAAYCLYGFLRPGTFPKLSVPPLENRKRSTSKERWVQVYETASREEAEQIQMRLQDEKIDCIVYEHGTKDIHGSSLPGFGIAVQKSTVPFAQKIISRLPV